MSPRRIALLLFLALAASSFVDRVQSRRLISLPGGAAPRLRDNHHSTAAIAAAPSDTATVAAAAAPSDTATVAAAAAFDATSTGSGRAAAASAAPTTLIAAAAAHTAGTSSSTPSAGSARAAAASATSANAIAAAGSHTISMNGSTTGAGSGSNLGTTTIGSSKCRWCWWRGWKGSSAKKSAGGSTRGFMRPYSGKVPSYAAKSVSFKGGPVMSQPLEVFLIFHGTWPDSQRTPITNFVDSISEATLANKPGSVKDWWNINCLYKSGATFVTPTVSRSNTEIDIGTASSGSGQAPLKKADLFRSSTSRSCRGRCRE
ncbi:hypothetical protein CLOM_g9540 [Closterium sp. NIES-68]|nr:hypothetical protein CLOM_g9540 [Closterium sp. NIES-68]GJP61170.1 hypothetical protein CLOP_g18362 [Closterium sp. NIES-67]